MVAVTATFAGTENTVACAVAFDISLSVLQGHKMALELFRVVQEDPRWVGAGPDLVPTKFNPDRSVACTSSDAPLKGASRYMLERRLLHMHTIMYGRWPPPLRNMSCTSRYVDQKFSC